MNAAPADRATRNRRLDALAAAIADYEAELLAKAAEAKVIKLDAVMADSTLVPANVVYPTDSGLPAKGVARLTMLVAALHAPGLARRSGFRGTGPARCGAGPGRRTAKLSRRCCGCGCRLHRGERRAVMSGT